MNNKIIIQLESAAPYFDDVIDYTGDLRSGASYTKYFYILYDGNGTYSIEFDNWSTELTVEFQISR